MKHLVDIHVDRCIGCTRCMRSCPTEAIRILNDKAHLLEDRCIFCGNCILNCHKDAYKVSSDSFANLNKHKVNVALLPTAVFGMLSNEKELAGIYQTMINYGFDEVYDLSLATELLRERINTFLHQKDDTYILSLCPSIVRLVQLKYPSLLPHLLPFDFPFEIGAKIARKIVSQKYNVNENEIGISYISECLSNFIAIKEGLGKSKSNIDNVFLFNDLLKNNVDSGEINVQVAKRGAKLATDNLVLSVDGIKSVDEVLEKVYLNQLNGVKLIQAYSCIGGCLGGNFTIENTFVAKWKMDQFYKLVDDKLSETFVNQYKDILSSQEWLFEDQVQPESPYKLSDNINQSIIKMVQINNILKQLPNIDCCACGSPSCRALAEDVVNHVKTIDDCYIIQRGKNHES